MKTLKTFGQVIRESRLEKHFTLDDLETATKIRRNFLVAIEKENWGVLPEYPVLQGFVRSIGHALDTDENKLVAFLRRDYPPKQLPVNPKPDIEKKVRWSPRLTFVLGVLAIMLVVVGYLVYQYSVFVSPPNLVVDNPPDNFVTPELKVTVSGKTSSDATVTVNSQPFVVESDGKFAGEIEITPETNSLEIKATSRAGRASTLTRKIQFQQ